ncbi:hypothetical protein [Paenibacillus sp. IHBB 10380]|uniref:hypothetical protein n=1 Tax=Paenibacillus sp. IHBB 10380 TaxID=1566358 RepID=UPI0005CFE17B|nr:hypothetical protein [Paenibacillus sp. IHBB 10380]AJS57357.1 hypothetical protein UB51_01295 [Paenibacillus sp. IHBB 10380]
MSISKAKKARQKLAQQGKVNPELLRGSWHGVKPTVKVTPTLKQKRTQMYNKYKRNPAHDSSDSFYFFYLLTCA